jgi:hypothetical protein
MCIDADGFAQDITWLAGILVFDTNVDYPLPCTLYVFFFSVIDFCCF